MKQLSPSKNYFKIKREKMVKEQIFARGIRNKKVISAMLKVKRELFVPQTLFKDAYGDYPLPIGESQTISQPYMVGEMTSKLELQKEHKILEIGTGSGYQTAILAELVSKVYSVEIIESLANRAKNTLQNLGYKNVLIKNGDGSIGFPEYAPYDRILVTAGAPETPEHLFEQLKENGILVVPVGNRVSQTLIRIRKEQGKKKEERFFECTFVALKGTHGWK